MRTTRVHTARTAVAAAAVLALIVTACGSPEADVPDSAAEAPDTPEDPDIDEPEGVVLPDEFDERTFTMASVTPPEHWLSRTEQAFADSLEERSDGRITSEIHWSAALGGPAELIGLYADGVADSGLAMPYAAPAGFDVFNWGTQLFSSAPSASEPILGQLIRFGASLEWALAFEDVIEEYEAQGVAPIIPLWNNHDANHLMCTRPVTSLEDAQGSPTRITGPAWLPEFEALGLEPVTLTALEQYEAFQRGVIDCVVTNLRDVLDWSLQEVITDLMLDSEVAFAGTAFGYAFSPDTWESLGPEGRQLAWYAMWDAAVEMNRLLIAGDLATMEAAEEYDIAIHEMGEGMRAALNEYQEGLATELAETAPDAVTDPEAVIADFQRTREKWADLVINQLGYGDQVPGTWEEVRDSGFSIDDLDLDPFRQALWDEVFAPNMPN